MLQNAGPLLLFGGALGISVFARLRESLFFFVRNCFGSSGGFWGSGAGVLTFLSFRAGVCSAFSGLGRICFLSFRALGGYVSCLFGLCTVMFLAFSGFGRICFLSFRALGGYVSCLFGLRAVVSTQLEEFHRKRKISYLVLRECFRRIAVETIQEFKKHCN